MTTDARDSKWITIHPGQSGKGVHVKVDGDGNAVAGNPHLVAALNHKSGELPTDGAGSEQNGYVFNPPTDEFADFLNLWNPADHDEFNSLLDEDAPKKPTLNFKERIAKVGNAKEYLGKALKTIHGTADEFVNSLVEIPSHLRAKVLACYRKGNKETREQGAKNIAATISYLKEILIKDAIDFKNIQAVPCTTKGAVASFTEDFHVNSMFYGSKTVEVNCLNIAPVSPSQLALKDAQRKEFEKNGKSPFTVESRYPAEDTDFMVCCHEIAHAAYSMNNLKHAWKPALHEALAQGYDFEKGVSKYAWYGKNWDRKINECHSECFAMMCHPDYKRGTLPKPVEDYFDMTFFGGKSA